MAICDSRSNIPMTGVDKQEKETFSQLGKRDEQNEGFSRQVAAVSRRMCVGIAMALGLLSVRGRSSSRRSPSERARFGGRRFWS